LKIDYFLFIKQYIKFCLKKKKEEEEEEVECFKVDKREWLEGVT
jgi:hypothetical protein